MRHSEAAMDSPAALAAGFRVVRTLWLVELVVAVAICLGAPVLLARPAAAGGPAGMLARIFIAVAAADLAVAWWIKHRAAKTRARPAIMGASLVAVTLALTPAVLALALYVGFGYIDGHRILSGMSLAGLWILRPRLSEWTAP
jgi:hypothetical protein